MEKSGLKYDILSYTISIIMADQLLHWKYLNYGDSVIVKQKTEVNGCHCVFYILWI